MINIQTFIRYCNEKYSYSRYLVYEKLRRTAEWKQYPHFGPEDSPEKRRVLGMKHRWVTRTLIGSFLRHGLVQIPHIDLIVTSYCSLNCKNCSAWIPYLKEKKNFSFESIKQNLDRIFDKVDYVGRIAIIGGEALLNKDISKILAYLVQHKNQIGVILLITNGTILPDEDTVEVLRTGEIDLVLDFYKTEKDKRRELTSLLDRDGIRYESQENFDWVDIGTYGAVYNSRPADCRKVYDNCQFRNCTALYDGKLFRCSRSYVMESNGLDVEDPDARIVLGGVRSKIDMYKKLIRFFGVPYIKACKYCNDLKMAKRVPAGEQIQ